MSPQKTPEKNPPTPSLSNTAVAPVDPIRAKFQKASETLLESYTKVTFAAQLESLVQETEGSEILLKNILIEMLNRPESMDVISKKANAGREKEDLLDLESCVRFLGIQNMKVFLVAEKLSDVFDSKLLFRSQQTQELVVPPRTLLQYAIKAQTEFGEDSPQKDLSFASGLIFDLLFLVNSKTPDAGKKMKIEAFIAESFTLGLEIAKTGLVLGKERKRLVLGEHLVSIALINQASHVAMAMMVEGYVEFLGKLRQAKIPPFSQLFAVNHQFQGSHTEFSPLLVWPFPIFNQLIPALRNLETPFVLSDREDVNFYDAASIHLLAEHVLRNQGKFQTGIQLDAKEMRPELRKLDLSFNLDSIFKKKGGQNGNPN
jgi:hypothetical protein